MKRSTILWFNIVCIAVNFSSLILSGLTRNWVFFGISALCILLSQSAISNITNDLDKVEEIENEQRD